MPEIKDLGRIPGWCQVGGSEMPTDWKLCRGTVLVT